jgi:hypothetical protein
MLPPIARPMNNDKQLQVFISSTYIDLIEERRAIMDGVWLAGCVPAAMENFDPDNRPPIATIRDWIDKSDVFILLLGHRYGDLEPGSTVSYIELEFDYAKMRGKEMFSLVLDDSLKEERLKRLGEKAIETDHTEKFRSFRNGKVKKNLCSIVNSTDPRNLKLVVSKTLANLRSKPNLVGWIRGDAPEIQLLREKLARTESEALDMERDNQYLRNRLNDVLQSRVFLMNNFYVATATPGPIVSTVFPSVGKSKQLEIQREIVALLDQINYLSECWSNWHRFKALKTKDWNQKLEWFTGTVWEWIKNSKTISKVNDHLIEVRDFQDPDFADFYIELIAYLKAAKKRARLVESADTPTAEKRGRSPFV